MSFRRTPQLPPEMRIRRRSPKLTPFSVGPTASASTTPIAPCASTTMVPLPKSTSTAVPHGVNFLSMITVRY